MRRKLSRTSCLTDLETQPLARSSARVEGRTETDFTRTSPIRNAEGNFVLCYCRGTVAPLVLVCGLGENPMRWQLPLALLAIALMAFVSSAYPPSEPKVDDPWLAKYMPPRGYVAYRA